MLLIIEFIITNLTTINPPNPL